MKVVLRNSSVVYEEIQWTKVTKNDDARLNVTLGAASDFDGPHTMQVKVTIKAVHGGATPLTTIPYMSLGIGPEENSENLSSYLGQVENVSGTIGSVITTSYTFNLSQSSATDKYVKFGFSGDYTANITLRKYEFDVEYLLQ